MPRPALCLLRLAAVLCVGLRAGAQAPASDVAGLLAAQDAQLGARPGTLTLTQPGTLASAVTLSPGHDLLLAAPLTVTTGSFRLSGRNTVTCRAPITRSGSGDLFLAENAADLTLRHCTVTATGTPGGYLLVATHASRITLQDNHLLNLALFNTRNPGPASLTTDVTLTGNSSRFPAGNGPIALYLLYVRRGVISDNTLEGHTQGIEWWGGDANGQWRGPASVTAAGQFTITGNVCTHVGGACVWGSMGFGSTIQGNRAQGCGDVCFDDEGGVDNTFTHNQAADCNFGCFAVEFETANAVFRANQATTSAGHALVLVKHGPGNPYSHTHLQVLDNLLTCAQLCTALYTEGDDGLTFAGNRITNAVIDTVNYHGDFLVADNTFLFTVDPGGKPAVAAPALFHHHSSVVRANLLTDRAPADPATVCLAQSWSDFNDTDTMSLAANTCTGFATGILTTTAGTNPGAPRALWSITGNRILGAAPGQAIVHRHPSGNESYTLGPGNTADGRPLPSIP